MLRVMRATHALVIVLALLFWNTPAMDAFLFHDDEEHDPQSFKEVVHRLIRASRENLRPLKTFRVDMHPAGNYWYEVTVLLPGAKICRIFEHPRMVYWCEWKKANNVPATAVYKSVVESFQAALGSNDWNGGARSPGILTRFEPANPRRNPAIEVRLVGSNASGKVEVSLYAVDRWGDSP